jgi:acylphosphatase
MVSENQQKSRVHIFVSGRVQRVFFRDSTRRKAKELGLLGWVRNLSDGRVEIVAEGEKDDLEKLVQWAKKGSFLARVDKIEIKWKEYKGEFKDFEIKYRSLLIEKDNEG